MTVRKINYCFRWSTSNLNYYEFVPDTERFREKIYFNFCRPLSILFNSKICLRIRAVWSNFDGNFRTRLVSLCSVIFRFARLLFADETPTEFKKYNHGRVWGFPEFSGAGRNSQGGPDASRRRKDVNNRCYSMQASCPDSWCPARNEIAVSPQTPLLQLSPPSHTSHHAVESTMEPHPVHPNPSCKTCPPFWIPWLQTRCSAALRWYTNDWNVDTWGFARSLLRFIW